MSHIPNTPTLELVATNSLRVPETHARRHSDKHVARIAAAIEASTVTVPLIVDDDNLIVSGVGRWLAAKLRKIEMLPVMRVKFLSAAQRRAFALAENRLVELGEWDDEKLQEELKFLLDCDYGLGATGFEFSDVDFGVAVEETGEPVELITVDTAPVTRLGDLWSWRGGEFKLYCGNARDAVSYEALLGDERARLVFTDLPYNVRIPNNVSGLGKTVHRDFFEASGEMSPPEFTTFLRQIFKLLVRFSHGGSIHYHCMDFRHARELLDASDGVYSEFKQLAVWVKQAGMGAFLRNAHELVFIMKAGKEAHINNIGLSGKGARFRTNVWEHSVGAAFSKARAADLAVHPTIKPTALVADALLDTSNRGDLVLDPTVGSGTTLQAAARTGRRAAGIEIDPIYCDVAIRRLSKAIGEEPRLPDGRIFADVEADRKNEETAGG